LPFLRGLYGIDTLAVMCHAGPTPGLLDIALGLAVPTRATRSGEDLWLGHACHYVDTGCRRDRMRRRVTELSGITCVLRPYKSGLRDLGDTYTYAFRHSCLWGRYTT
jgi:hypothetical protein